MASWSYSLDGSTITFTVYGVPKNAQYRVFLRYADDASSSILGKNEQYPESTSATKSSVSFDVLEEYTSYRCSAGYPSDPVEWIICTNKDANGEKYAEFTTGSFDSGPERPSDWKWYSTIKQGRAIELTALEWNDFCSRINEFRDYSGLSRYSFTRVSRGDPIEASVVNEAQSAISSISGHGTLPTKARSGRAITASFFNGLKDALNYID